VGAPIDSYDPVLTGTLSVDRMLVQDANPTLFGGPTYRENTNVYNFQYAQGWATGTLAQVSFSNQRLANNIPLGERGIQHFQPGDLRVVESDGAAASVAGLGNG